MLVSNDKGHLALAAGQAATAAAGKAPVSHIVLRPRDAVEWTLYYPPVLAVLGGRVDRAPAEVPSSLMEAIQYAGRGNPASAFKVLDRVADADRDARFFLYPAALFLSVGRVMARADIDKALKQDPKAGLAYALRAIIHVAQNEREQALATQRGPIRSARRRPRRSRCPMRNRQMFG